MVANEIPQIRGTADDKTQMLLGQIRQVFEPDYLQVFESGRFTVQFMGDDTEAREELLAFAEMYGYELREFSDRAFKSYYFE